MPFSYYARLSRAQQAIYRKSDEIVEVRLPEPARLHPAVEALTAALGSEQRVAVQQATDRLIRGLTDTLGVPPVKVEVLAARPHATGEAWFRRSQDERLARLARTPDEAATALTGRAASALARRPAAEAWSPTEIVCHLRDIEELFGQRFETILANDEPALVEAGPADRWASERQYRRHDAASALEHFRRRRGESLATLMALPPADWQRGGAHPVRGHLT